MCGSQRAQALLLVRHVQEGAERADDEADALLDRRLAQVAEAQVEKLGEARALGLFAADVQHALATSRRR